MSDRVDQAWHDQAARSLDAMHDRAVKAEARVDLLTDEFYRVCEEIEAYDRLGELGDWPSVLKTVAASRAALSNKTSPS